MHPSTLTLLYSMVMVSSAVSLTPPCWIELDRECLGTAKFDNGYSSCFPPTKPDACSEKAWKKLKKCRGNSNCGLKACPPPPPPPEYENIAGYENCTKPTKDFMHETSVCLIPLKYKPAKCNQATYNALVALAKERKLGYCPYFD